MTTQHPSCSEWKHPAGLGGLQGIFAALAMLLFLLLAAAPAQAQLSTGTMFGTVTDATGAAIPNATIVITQTQTNFTRSTASNANGEYRAEFLPVGPYTVKVTAPGFEETLRKGLVLTATEVAEVGYQLKTGAVSDVVEVTAEVPLVNAGNSILGRTVSNIEVDNLPLVNRDTYQLLTLTAGVQQVTNENSLGFPMEHVLINGSSDDLSGQVSYYLDGGLNQTGLRNTGNSIPNPDAVDQFHVDTSNFSAQYGRTGAGVVTILTKSGTNSVHGSVFEFHQETNFNSDAWLQTTRTPEHINRFGATVGAPILKDKIFVFGSFGGLRQVSPTNFNTVVPDALQRVGNFSENLPTTTPASGLGACATTLNAADKANTNYGGKFFVCDPVTHTVVPGNRLDLDPNFMPDPVAAAVLAKNVPLPTPNRPTPDNRFIGNEGLSTNNNEFLAKGDLDFIPKHRITLDYFLTNGVQVVLPSGSSLPGWALSDYTYTQHNANVSETWTVSNKAVNQVWLSYTRLLGGRVSTPGESLDAYGSNINVQGTPSLAQISVAGFFTLGNAITGPKAGDNVYGVRDVYSTTFGKHTINVGGEVYLEYDHLQTLLNNYGVFAFTNSTVPSTASGQATFLKTGVAMADFLIGHPNAMSQDSPDDGNERYWNYAGFLQDDWRALRNLTINLGLRYDVQTAPVDNQRRVAVFSPGTQSTVSPLAIPGQLFPGDAGIPASGVGTRYSHVSPRLGFTFDPYSNGKTIFHGGAGLFYDSISGNEFLLSQNFQPFAVRETSAFTHVVSLANIYATDPTDFAGGVSPFPYFYNPANPKYVSPASLVFVQQHMAWPYNVQANFGVQQQFTKDLALSINYVGAFSRKLPLYIDHNAPIYNTANPASNTTGDVNCRRPYDAVPFATGSTTACASPAVGSKYYSNAYVIEAGQNTNYHGLQVTVEKRLSQSFSVNAFYIWSKALATAELQTTGNIGNSAGSEPEDYYNLRLERQLSDNDQRHQVAGSITWKPNYYKGKNLLGNGVLNGWTVAAILRANTGKPFNITTGTDDNFDGDTNDRPNLVPGQIPGNLSYNRSPATISSSHVFNIAAYCRNGAVGCPAGTGPSGLDGTVSPNAGTAPGYRDVDASLFRDFRIYERVKLQLRGEATNVFNLVNPNAPGATLNSSAFGIISGGAPMRFIQVGGRILF